MLLIPLRLSWEPLLTSALPLSGLGNMNVVQDGVTGGVLSYGQIQLRAFHGCPEDRNKKLAG